MRLLPYNESYDILFSNDTLRGMVQAHIEKSCPNVAAACMEVGVSVEDFYGWLTAGKKNESRVFNQWQLINLLAKFGLKIVLTIEQSGEVRN